MSTSSVDGYRIRLASQWATLGGSHDAVDAGVANEHIVNLRWFREELTAAMSIGIGWDLELAVPYDIKAVRAKYRLPDGSPYDNPEGDLHHRTETLEGVSDLKLIVNRRLTDVFIPHDAFHIGAGVTIPTGHVGKDPIRLGAQGLEHEHIQFGTGTIDPLVRADWSLPSGDWGFDASIGVMVPLYEGSRGYRGAALWDAGLGPRFRIGEGLVLSLRYSIQYQTRAFWHGEPDENSGYTFQGITLAVPVQISKTLTVVPNAFRTLSFHARGGGDTFEMDWMIGVALELALSADR